MRILECIHALEPGGAQRLLVDLSNHLSNTDEVIVFTLKNRSDRKEDFYLQQISKRVRFVSLNLSDGLHISYLLKVYKMVKKLNPDIVHIHCIVQYFILAILFYKKCSYIQTLHNEARHGVIQYLWNIWNWLLRSKLLHVVTISQTNRESFRTQTRLACDILIYNGRKLPEKSEKFNATAAFLNSFKGHSDDTLLLSIARSAPQKNIEMLVFAVNELVEQGEHLQLILIGDYESNELGRKWMSLAGPAVHFIGVKDNVADYFCLCDAFCLPSLYEGMPITLIEALSCCCIPICTPCSGVIDVVEDGYSGFISNSFSKTDYQKAIIRFLKNSKLMDRKVLHNIYQSKFSIESCAFQYKQLFSSLSSCTYLNTDKYG